MTNVNECMSNDFKWVSPETKLSEAASIMRDNDLGFLPVAEDDRLVGMVTDRDIVTRAIAENKGTTTSVREVMTQKTYYCYDDQSTQEVCNNMAKLQIRRMPVVNRDKRLVGVVSIGDLAQTSDNEVVGKAEQQITQQCCNNHKKAA